MIRNQAGIVLAISLKRSQDKEVAEWIPKKRHSDIFASSFFGELSLKEEVSSIFPISFSASLRVLPALRFV